MKVLKIRCSIIAKILAITFLLEFVPYFGITQSMNCGFDVIFEGNMSNGSTFYELFNENEESIIDAMNDPQMMALLNGTSSYTIPVVVHVMHLGEPEGVGSNISDAQIIQAINDLNATFANASNNGVDIGIQFCLAERAPDNQSTDGIVRVNASGICSGSCYGSGMTVGGPLDRAVKAASIWPNQDYVNIWVVHSIIGALGYATFPNSPSAEDGIVIDDDYFGIGGSNVLSHEAGHFLNLFHTFQGDCPSGVNCNQNCATSTVCPTNVPCDNDPNNDQTEVCCRVQGDRVCDTPPHKRSCFTCEPAGSNSCDNNSSNSLFVHNFMDYSSLSCMDRFTDGQRMRMRCALMDLRSSLMNSLGCTPACTSAIANFEGPDDGMEGEILCFTNTSIGATDYTWELNGESQTNSANFCFEFTTPGTYHLCLTASNLICANRICQKVVILWDANHCTFELPECEIIYNGDFSNVSPNEDFHSDDFTFNRVCNWYNRRSSPEFMINSQFGNSWLFWYSYNWNEESIGTTTELNLIAGNDYNLSFDYSVVKPYGSDADKLDLLKIGLSETLLEGNSNTIIWEIEEPKNDFVYGNTYYFRTIHHVNKCFTYTGDMGRYLYVDGVPDMNAARIVVIRNIQINSCTCSEPICNPNPVIIYSQDSCSFTFQAMNDGDPGDCYWDFGDGTSAEGCEVTHEYIFGGTFNVCLTIACDEYTQETVCDSITVSIDCENCVELELNALASKCDDNESGSYMTKVDFIVPKGTKTCNDGLFVWSNDAHVSVTSFEIENLNPTNDQVVACFNLTPYSGIDLESQNTVVYVTLCDSLDNMICYTFNVKAASCENCLGEITVTAACADPNPFDGEYIYTGTVNITFPADGFQPCNADPLSSEIGYSHSITMNGSGNQATIDFTINTEREGDFNASSLLCFFIGDIQYCYTLNIEVEPCPVPPTDCVEKWIPKSVYCTRGQEGTLSYNFSMGTGMISSSGYQLCGFGFQGTLTDQNDNPIDGGSVQINTGAQTGSSFVFDIDINVPCEYEGGIVVLRLYFCDIRGDMVCYYFPLKLEACEIDCGDSGSIGPDGRTISSDIKKASLHMYPNPTQNDVVLKIENATSKQHSLTIYDLVGNKVLIQSFSTNIRLDLINLHSGIHFVSVTDDEGNLIGIEKLIILK